MLALALVGVDTFADEGSPNQGLLGDWDEATRAQSRSGLPMFGDSLPA